MSRALEVARLELRAQLATPLPWALVASTAFATLTVNPAAMIASGDAAVGGLRPFGNSVYALAQVFALTGVIFYPLLTSMAAGRAIVGDEDARVGDLLHSTPLTPLEYVSGKFLGVLAVLGIAVALHVTIAAAWYELGPAVGADVVRGPFHAGHYLLAASVFLAPGVICCAGVAFAAAERGRSAMPVYAVGTGFFFLTLAGLVPGASAMHPALDPFFAATDVWGARWLSRTVFDADRGVAFYNTAPLVLDRGFLLNRLLTLAFALLAVAASVRHCRRRLRGEEPAPPRWWATRASARVGPRASRILRTAATQADLSTTTSPPSLVEATIVVARHETRQLLRQPAYLLFLLFGALLSWEVGGAATGVFETPLLVTSGTLAVGLWEVVVTLGCLLLLFHIVESVWRLQSTGVQAFILSAPIPTTALLLGVQVAGMVGVTGLLVACGLVCLLMIAVQGHVAIDLFPFLLVWGPVLAPTFLAWSSAVILLTAALRHRYATYVAGLALLAATAASLLQGATTWTTNWTLWNTLRWSDLGVFDLNGAPLLANRLMVTAAAGGLFALAVQAFVRTERDAAARAGWPARRALLRRAWRVAPWAVVAVVPAVWLSAGVEAGFQGDAVRTRWRDYWRRNVATWAHVRPPAVRHVEARITLEPARRRMHVTGSYAVDVEPIDPGTPLAFTVGPSIDDVVWRIDDTAAVHDDRSGLHVVPMPVGRRPGQLLRIGFTYDAEIPRGITRNGGGHSVFILPSGALLTTLSPDFLPVPGFMDGHGLDAADRPWPREYPDDHWRGPLPPVVGNPAAFTSRLEIDAPAGFTVNAVGDRISQRIQGGRTVAIWQSDVPVRFLSIVAGRWTVQADGETAVFHHGEHGHNAREMLATLTTARRHFSEWFGPYPWRTLTLSEFPDHVSRAQSFPTNIPFSEGMGWLARPGASMAAAIVTAHEVAHQWWGHLVTPGLAPGADILIESMAHYATLRWLEAERGHDARAEFARALETRYADQRRVDVERPLARILGLDRPADETAIYDKGGLVLWMLERHLGRARMDDGLRTFVAGVRTRGHHPALHDLLETLRPLAPSPTGFDRFHAQWFSDVVMPEFEVRDAVAEGLDGRWRVTATVENIGTGETDVQVSVARGDAHGALDPPGNSADAVLSVTLSPGQPRFVQWTVPWRPERVVVDPDVHLLQANRSRAAAQVRVPDDR